MHLVLDRSVARQDREKAFSGLLADWETARVFRQAVRCGSNLFDLFLDVVRRCRVDLEWQIAAAWFTRGVRDLMRGRRSWHPDRLRAPASACGQADRDCGAIMPSIENRYGGCAARDPLGVKTRASGAKRAIMVTAGAGIGVLPTVTGAFGGCPAPREVDWRRPLEIGLADHPDHSRVPRRRHPVDRLAETFNPAKFPWFKDEFVHPPGFKAVYMGKPLTHFFRGFLDEGR